MATNTTTAGRNGKADTLPPQEGETTATVPTGALTSTEQAIDALFAKAKNRKVNMRVKTPNRTYAVRSDKGVPSYTAEGVAAAAREGVKTGITFLGGKVTERGEQSGDEAEALVKTLLAAE
jgi:hypothetical protein